MITVSRDGTTIPHRVIGKFSKGSILMMPAAVGTGVIAGNHARAVLELAGIKDIKAKSYGSNNPINTVKATARGTGSAARLRNRWSACAASPWTKRRTSICS